MGTISRRRSFAPRRVAYRAIRGLGVSALALIVWWPLSPTVNTFAPGDDNLRADYARIVGIAHNAGNSQETTRAALAAGAEVIEIDVAALDGELVAAHTIPRFWPGAEAFGGPTLAEAWTDVAPAETVLLDVKEPSALVLHLMVTFLAEHGDEDVIVASRDDHVLSVVDRRAPGVRRWLSISTADRLRQVARDPATTSTIDGVTVRHELLDDAALAWMRERGLFVAAWTVNDFPRLNELAHLGVNAIATDDPTILELLGGRMDGQQTYAWPSSSTQARPQPTEHESEQTGSQDEPGKLKIEVPGEKADLDVLVVLHDKDNEQRQDHRPNGDTSRSPPLLRS